MENFGLFLIIIAIMLAISAVIILIIRKAQAKKVPTEGEILTRKSEILSLGVIKPVINKILDVIFKYFWIIFLTMISVAIMDLISLTVKSKEFGAGFVLAFLYFVGWFFYNFFKK